MADSILLIPAPEHREALLGGSPGGGRVPVQLVCSGCGSLHIARADEDDEDSCLRCCVCGGLFNGWGVYHVQALVLRWRGVDDPMGITRAVQAAGIVANTVVETAETVALFSPVTRLGRIVHLDADGREVTP